MPWKVGASARTSTSANRSGCSPVIWPTMADPGSSRNSSPWTGPPSTFTLRSVEGAYPSPSTQTR